jgi:hypothetical protein
MAKVQAIAHAVGKNGLNQTKDVKLVQRLLNRALTKWPAFAGADAKALKDDGVCGPVTIKRIEAFQRGVLKWSGPAVDATVDPNGRTWKKLAGNVASASQIKPVATARPQWVDTYAAFRQGDYSEKLGHATAGTDSIARYGCAMCSLTMAATYIGSRTEHWPPDLKPEQLTPPLVNEILRKAGAFSGFLLTMPKAAEALGMTYEEYGKTSDLDDKDLPRIDSHLKAGLPIAAHVDYKKTSVGDHWILIISRNGDGTYRAIDPSYGRSMLLTSGAGMTVDNTRYAETKAEKTAVLFGYGGSGGSASQQKYLVVRYALLKPAAGAPVAQYCA